MNTIMTITIIAQITVVSSIFQTQSQSMLILALFQISHVSQMVASTIFPLLPIHILNFAKWFTRTSTMLVMAAFSMALASALSFTIQYSTILIVRTYELAMAGYST
jgi:hypothetical protein